MEKIKAFILRLIAMLLNRFSEQDLKERLEQILKEDRKK